MREFKSMVLKYHKYVKIVLKDKGKIRYYKKLKIIN